MNIEEILNRYKSGTIIIGDGGFSVNLRIRYTNKMTWIAEFLDISLNKFDESEDKSFERAILKLIGANKENYISDLGLEDLTKK